MYSLFLVWYIYVSIFFYALPNVNISLGKLRIHVDFHTQSETNNLWKLKTTEPAAKTLVKHWTNGGPNCHSTWMVEKPYRLFFSISQEPVPLLPFLPDRMSSARKQIHREIRCLWICRAAAGGCQTNKWKLLRSPIPLITVPCKAKRQQLLTFQVSSCCLLALQSRSTTWRLFCRRCQRRWLVAVRI